MRGARVGWLALAVVLLAGAAAAKPKALTAQGEVRGFEEDGVDVFRGIPYAAAPTGSLRWHPPQPGPQWEGARETSEYGARCPQYDRMGENVEAVLKLQGVGWVGRQLVKAMLAFSSPPPIAEDCLYLNVQTANRGREPRQPVMVWIHGGGHSNGSGSQRPYGSNALVERGIVQVTINYRLGPLGFLAHPALSAESTTGTSGNYGLLDQIAALEWVRDNIAEFGGDPANVTIFGESAGGHSVGQLLASPLARGLFHKAIAMSGTGTHQLLHLRAALPEQPSAEAAGVEAARRVGVEPGPDAASRLRALSFRQVLAMSDGSLRAGRAFHPVVDGWVLPRTAAEIFAAGEQAPVPLIAGTTSDEGNLFGMLAGDRAPTLVGDDTPLDSPEAYAAALRVRFDDDAERMLELYPGDTAEAIRRSTNALFTDTYFGASARQAVGAQRALAQPAWLYLFTRTPPGERASVGAIHGADVQFTFDSLLPIGPSNDYDAELARTLGDYLVQFARTGDPNLPGHSAWPRYDSSDPQWMELGERIGAAPVSRTEAYDASDRAQLRRIQALRAARNGDAR